MLAATNSEIRIGVVLNGFDAKLHTGLTVLKPYWRRKGMSMMLRHPLPTNLRDNIVSMS